MKHYSLFIFLLIATTSLAQSNNSSKPPSNWQLMDWQQDGYPGISMEIPKSLINYKISFNERAAKGKVILAQRTAITYELALAQV